MAKLEQTKIKRQDESRYVEDYAAKVAQIKMLKQKNLSSEDREAIAKLMARYQSQIEEQIRDNRVAPNPRISPSNAPNINNDSDTAVVLSLFNNVDQAISEKKRKRH